MLLKTVLAHLEWVLCIILDSACNVFTNKVVKSSLAVFLNVFFEVFVYAALGLCCVIISVFLQVYDVFPKHEQKADEADATANEVQQTC